MSKPTAQEFIAALRRLEEAGDVEAMIPLYADDARISNPTDTAPLVGPDGVRKFWDAYRKSFDEIGSRFHNVVESDKAALLEWTSDCRTTAGLETSYDGVSVFETQDGKITRFTAYFDPADLSATPDGAPGHGGQHRRPDGGYGTVTDGSDVAADAR
jgi:steroid delta-isomerase-like uncharacterized protein